jgi:exodeoxyribonuclease VII large subunit
LPDPLISAVGHETDTTLADFAADMRAPTPTAAAEMAVPVRAELLAQLGELGLRQRRAAMRYVALGRERLEVRAQRLPSVRSLLDGPAQALDEANERLRRGLETRAQVAQGQLQRVAGRLSLPLLAARLERARERLAAQRLAPAMLSARLREDKRRLDGVTRVMASLNPDAVLARGYVRVTGEDGRTLVGRKQAEGEGKLVLHFRDGTLDVTPVEGVAAAHGAKGPPRQAGSGRPVRLMRLPRIGTGRHVC